MCIRTVAIGRHESADKLCIEPIVGEIVFWNISENTCVWHRVLWKDKCIQTRIKELVHISDAGFSLRRRGGGGAQFERESYE